jgi:serine/threonine-protein kinase HipA
MERTLDVYLHQSFVGKYGQDNEGRIYFRYDAGWLYRPNSVQISHSLPLRKERFNRRECSAFFGGILPEQEQRKLVARNLGISENNDFAMLERIGGECAGAVTLIPTGQSFPELNYTYHTLDEEHLARILRELPHRPLLAGEDGIRLSLAGAQTKMAVHKSVEGLAVPKGGALSTHILKPDSRNFQGIVYNEALCMTLAQRAGLSTAMVEVGEAEQIPYLLVERYDRNEVRSDDGTLSNLRRHQEDFCQALGVSSERKYQSEGGPTLRDCFSLLRETCSIPARDLQLLLDGVIFNFLIGNYDAHGKNFSLLYDGTRPREIQLAPFYDLLCTGIYPYLSHRMAMKIGGDDDISVIFPRHFDQFADEAKLSRPLVKRRVPELANKVLTELANAVALYPKAHQVAEFITERCESTIRRFAG